MKKINHNGSRSAEPTVSTKLKIYQYQGSHVYTQKRQGRCWWAAFNYFSMPRTWVERRILRLEGLPEPWSDVQTYFSPWLQPSENFRSPNTTQISDKEQVCWNSQFASGKIMKLHAEASRSTDTKGWFGVSECFTPTDSENIEHG